MAFQGVVRCVCSPRFSSWRSAWRPQRWPSSAHTTRIETRPYYGAVVTIEHGVRVYRPVPPTQHLIINPDGATPLQLNVGEGDALRRGPLRRADAERGAARACLRDVACAARD